MNPINTCEQPTGRKSRGTPLISCPALSHRNLFHKFLVVPPYQGAAVSGAFLAHLWAVKDGLRRKGKTNVLNKA